MSTDTAIGSTSVPILDGSNYARWKLKMKNILESKELDDIVYGKEQRLSRTELMLIESKVTEDNKLQVAEAQKKAKSLKVQDAKARTVISCGLDDRHMDIVADCQTAKQIWERLRQEYVETSSTNFQMLLTEFFSYKKTPQITISEYVAKIDGMASKLRAFGQDQQEDAILVRIVTGLTDDFQDVIRIWNMTPTAHQNREVLLRNLRAEETRIQGTRPRGGEALMARVGRVGAKSDRKKQIEEWKKNGKCKSCGQIGHWWKECPTRQKDQPPRGDRDSNKSFNGSTNKTKYEKVRCSMAVAMDDHEDDQVWVFDSGASYHMTSHREWFTDYKPFDGKIPVKFGNRLTLDAVGKGTVILESIVGREKIQVHLEDTWYVPNIGSNLYSWGAAARKGIKLYSSDNELRLLDDQGVMMTGELLAYNLWKLNVTVPVKAHIAKTDRTLEQWHQVLGHPDIQQVKNLVQNECATGIRLSTESRQGIGCGDCQQGKSHHVPHASSRRERATETLERIHVDLVGPICPPSKGGATYFMLMKDEYSNYLFVYTLTSKKHVRMAIEKFLLEAERTTQKKVKILRSDNGTEFKNQGMAILCAKEGVIQEYSAPYTPQQNGEAERANRTIEEAARTMLSASNLPLSLWAEAVNTAVYLRNRMTNSRNKEQTPFELFYSHKPDLSHLIRFGEEVHIFDHGARQSKFSPKAIEAYMVGYGDRVNTYRCLVASSDDVIITPDVVIASHKEKTREKLETARPYSTFLVESEPTDKMSTASQPDDEAPTRCAETIDLPEITREEQRRACTLDQEGYDFDINGASRSTPKELTHALGAERVTLTHPESSSAQQLAPSAQAESSAQTAPSTEELPSLQPATIVAQTAPENQRAPSKPVASSTQQASQKSSLTQRLESVLTRKQTAGETIATQATLSNADQSLRSNQSVTQPGITTEKRVVPKRNVRSIYARNLMAMATIDEPTSYDEAILDPKWRAAIEAELDAHEKNETWRLIEKPAYVNEITAKWIFKVKYAANGQVDRYKARLVARGFTQVAGIDYGEIYAPVVRMDSVRLLFSLATQYRLEFKQFDITTAFLNGIVRENLYLTPPDGLQVKQGLTCKLRKSLYGLKQSPRCWNARFTEMLKLFNMKQTYSDPCVFVGTDPELIYLAIYVDDGLVFARNEATINRLIEYLTQHFDIKLVTSNCFLGVEIQRNTDRSEIFLHQTGYINRILQRFNMAESKGCATPLPVKHELIEPKTLEAPVETDVPYAELIGCLMYCGYATRPDIAHSLSILSKFNSNPRMEHWKAAKRVLRYLRNTSSYGLLYKPADQSSVVCYTDADWAGDHGNRRSISGMVTYIASGPISYKAQQQPVVALSTTEAEYIAAAYAVQELMWLKRFVEELMVASNMKIELLCDNQSAIKLMKNPEFHQRTKHIDIKYHFIREKWEDGLFEPRYVDTNNQLADIFTKALSTEKFEHLRKLIGCSPAPNVASG